MWLKNFYCIFAFRGFFWETFNCCWQIITVTYLYNIKHFYWFKLDIFFTYLVLCTTLFLITWVNIFLTVLFMHPHWVSIILLWFKNYALNPIDAGERKELVCMFICYFICSLLSVICSFIIGYSFFYDSGSLRRLLIVLTCNIGMLVIGQRQLWLWHSKLAIEYVLSSPLGSLIVWLGK